MSFKILFLLFIIIISGCKKTNDSNTIADKNIEYQIANDKVAGDFNKADHPLIQEALKLKTEKNFIEAIKKFNLAEQTYGEMISIYLNRGVIYSQIGENKLSIKDFSKVLEIDEEHHAALMNRGLAFVYESDFENAIQDLNLAIEIKPEEPAAYLNRAVAYREMDEIDLACKDLKEAKSLGIVEIYNSDMVLRMINSLCK